MPTLLESLKPKLGGTPTALPGTQLGQTQGLRNLIQTTTGKAATPGGQGPQQADVGELQAARETRLQGQQGALSEQINTAGMVEKSEGMASTQNQQAQSIAENVANNQSQFEIRSNSIISDYVNGGKKLSTQRDVMAMEQAGAALRLSNEKYVTELNRAGEMARLTSQAAFKEQAYRDEFLTDIILTKDNTSFRQMMDADDRTFAYAMGQMDIDYALEVADQARKQANSQAMWQGVGGVVSAGASTLSSKEAAGWFKSTPGTKPTSLGNDPGYVNNAPGQQTSDYGAR